MEEDMLIDLIAKELSGEISQEEREELHRLVSASPENGTIYNDLKSKWKAAGNLKVAVDPATDQSWERFESRRAKTFRLPSVLLRIAALLVIAAGIGYYFVGSQNSSETSFATARESKSISLPDGTKVTLNADSRLAYEGDFSGATRNVSLEGEAFFDVVKNPDRPFVITVSDATIEVLGTSFNVNAYSSSKDISVSVSTGRVAFRKRNAEDEVILEKGMYGLLDRGTNTLKSYDLIPGNPDYWRTGILSYSDLPLREVVADLSRNFNVTVAIEENKIGGCRFTSTFEQPKLDEILEILTLTMNLTLEKTADGYRLTGEGCNQF